MGQSLNEFALANLLPVVDNVAYRGISMLE